MKPIEVRLVGRFRFHSKLEGDHDSLLYRAVHTQTNDPLILKGEETKTAKVKKGTLSLLQEGKVYQSMQGGIGIPYMHWCGQQEEYNFIVLEEFECTLAKKIQLCGGKLSLKSALMVGLQLLTIFQYFHFKFFIYNNLNPKHVMLGKGQKYGKLFLIDYSRASRYKDAQSSEHFPQLQEKNTEIKNSNMELSSFNYHKGLLPSRRDDMESLLYLVAYLIKGELPWSAEVKNMKKTDFEKSRCALEIKSQPNNRTFSDYPQLQALYTYTLGLKFEQKPQYSYYSSTFSQMIEKRGMIEDKIYDWMLLDDQDTPDELAHHFELYSNQEEFLKKIGGESSHPRVQKLAKSIKIADKAANRKTKSDKQCQIY